MSEDKVKYTLIKKQLQPFQTFDVEDLDLDIIEITAELFPLKSKKFSVKENRDLKKPLLIEDMIKTLRDEHRITFTPEEYCNAKIILKEINYYRLSVFEKLNDSTSCSFTHLMDLYNFDLFLRSSLHSLIEPVEVMIKTSLAYHLTTNYDSLVENPSMDPALSYLDRQIYGSKVEENELKVILANFYETLETNVDKELSLQHHIEYYGGKIPFWVLVEFLTLGNISWFVSSLSRKVRTSWLKNCLIDYKGNPIAKSQKFLPEWIKTIQILRNTCAHSGRLYSRRFVYAPAYTNEDKEKFKEKLAEDTNITSVTEKFKHSLMGGLYILRKFYSVLSHERQEEWNRFIDKLFSKMEELEIPPYRLGNIPFEAMDFKISKGEN